MTQVSLDVPVALIHRSLSLEMCDLACMGAHSDFPETTNECRIIFENFKFAEQLDRSNFLEQQNKNARTQ